MTPEEGKRYGYEWIPGHKPEELKDRERRTPSDPYCPFWCPYQCTGDWKNGHCLIRIPEATKEIMQNADAGISSRGQSPLTETPGVSG